MYFTLTDRWRSHVIWPKRGTQKHVNIIWAHKATTFKFDILQRINNLIGITGFKRNIKAKSNKGALLTIFPTPLDFYKCPAQRKPEHNKPQAMKFGKQIACH